MSGYSSGADFPGASSSVAAMVQSNSGKRVESTKKSWKGCRKSAEIQRRKFHWQGNMEETVGKMPEKI
jgi:hypothetical protein